MGKVVRYGAGVVCMCDDIIGRPWVELVRISRLGCWDVGMLGTWELGSLGEGGRRNGVPALGGGGGMVRGSPTSATVFVRVRRRE
jgi:hypothetical protein